MMIFLIVCVSIMIGLALLGVMGVLITEKSTENNILQNKLKQNPNIKSIRVTEQAANKLKSGKDLKLIKKNKTNKQIKNKGK